jgi:hypothetical protein
MADFPVVAGSRLVWVVDRLDGMMAARLKEGMAMSEQLSELPPAQPSPPPPPPLTIPWRGLLAFALIVVFAGHLPWAIPNPYFPVDYYIPPFVLLALGVGVGLSAARTGKDLDRLLGIGVLVAGGGMVVYIISDCLRIING